MTPLRGPGAALLLGELRLQGGRMLLGLAAIALGVALGYAVHLINHAASTEFAGTVRALMGSADLEIRGPRSGFDEALYPRLARLPEVAAASPVVEVDARLAGRRDALKILGIDVFRAGAVHPDLIGRPAEEGAGTALLAPDAVFLSPAAQAWLGLEPGDELALQAGLDTLRFTVRGTLPAGGEGTRLAAMDIGAAQWRFGLAGRLQRIDLKLRPGVDPAAFRARLAPLLPAGVSAATPEESGRRATMLSRAYRVNLTVLSLVALFTGAFLVFTAQVLSVVRRRSQFALLRVLGLTRGGLARLVLAEAGVQGALGAALGLLLGYGIAAAALAWGGADLGAGYFRGVQPTVRFEPWAALAFFLLGWGAALLGSLVPALEAARAEPARALRAGDEETALRRLRPAWPGLLLLAAGLLLTRAPPVGELPLFGYLAIALLILGGIQLMPRLAHALFSRLQRPRPVPLHLALAQLGGAPGRASLGLAGILASFSLMAAMGIMVASFRVSVDDWLAAVLPADVYLRAAPAGNSGFLDPAAQEAIRTTPGVARAEFLRMEQLSLDPERPPVALLARAVDPANPAARIPLVGAPRPPRPGEPPPVWVSEAMVDLYGHRVGGRAVLPLAGRSVEVTVAGVWRDYARQHGAVVMGEADYRRLTGDARASDAALWLAPGSGAAEVAERLKGRLPGGTGLEFALPGEIRALSLRIFDRSFAVTYVLEAAAIAIGLAGIAAGFGGQALARRREFGMLRHLGVTRRQIGAMLALEGGLLAGLGVAAGLALGAVVAMILVHVVNPQSFHWTMEVHFPWGLLAAVAAALVACAGLTAVWAGRRAMAADAVRAVREDW